jgi:hypothetical protein
MKDLVAEAGHMKWAVQAIENTDAQLQSLTSY